MAIYNALKRHAARIVVVIDGQACSIASLVAMAGDEVLMPANTLLMIHAPHTIAWGNANGMRQLAETLDKHAEAMATSYIAKTNKPDEVRQLLADGLDHWFTATEAVEFGFADRIADDVSAQADADAAAAAAALTSYICAISHAPASVAACLRSHIQAAAQPHVFTSLAEATQRAVVAHIEDPSMKEKLNAIIRANAGGGGTSTPAVPTPPAPQPTPAASITDVQAAVAAERARVRERNDAINAALEPHLANAEIRALRDRELANCEGMSVGDINAAALRILAAGATPIAGAGRAAVTADERDKLRGAMQQAITARAGGARTDGQNEFRGHTLFEMARACADRAGVNTRGMDRIEIVGSAFTHTTSDFPLLLGNTARAALLAGYEEAPETFPDFSRAITLTDFKETSAAGLGQFSDLDKIPEGGEYKYGTFGERGQKIRLVKFGKLFSITREAVINDDLGAFTQVPRKMGRAAKRTLGNEVFKLITSNPVMSDGKTLFHAAHGNLLTGAALTTATLSAMRAAMAKQKGADGSRINVPLKYVLVPVGLGDVARAILAAEFEVGGTAGSNTPNVMRNRFEVIEDPRLDDADPDGWYGVADPDLFDGLIVGYLDGRQEPYLEQKEGWSVDGVESKVRLEAGASVVVHIAFQKNPGPA
jgi:phage major head subunit gpT-like protein